MTNEEILLVQTSWRRVLPIKDAAAELFYHRLFGMDPTLRELFMAPSDRFDMKKALLSVLAGDIFGKTPIRKGLFFFRLAYYAFSLANLRRSLAALRRRAFNIRDDSEMRLSRS
jgi:hypothetical protein